MGLAVFACLASRGNLLQTPRWIPEEFLALGLKLNDIKSSLWHLNKINVLPGEKDLRSFTF